MMTAQRRWPQTCSAAFPLHQNPPASTHNARLQGRANSALHEVMNKNISPPSPFSMEVLRPRGQEELELAFGRRLSPASLITALLSDGACMMQEVNEMITSLHWF